MERALKERIIGAIVLVAVVVLVVPVFLDGPSVEGEVRSERVPLPGQDVEETQTVVLDRNRTEPVPARINASAASGGPVADKPPGPRPQPVRQEEDKPLAASTSAAASGNEPAADASEETSPAAAAPAREEVAARADDAPARSASATGMFAVQLGSFSSKENADKLAADLRKQGFAAFLSQLDTDKGQLHRVRVGPQKDRKSAEAMAARLAKAGHEGQVVPHP